MMLDVLAHRAIGFGLENSPSAVTTALESGLGVEVDLRISKGGDPYISHDPLNDHKGWEFARYLPLFADYPDRTIAINVKDTKAALKALDFFEDGSITKGFAFDFELLGAPLPAKSPIAVRVSDLVGERPEEINFEGAGYVWLDEMEREWVTPDVIREIGSRSLCYWVSPELHGRDWFERWRALEPFEGLTGICTDHALEFLRTYGSVADD